MYITDAMEYVKQKVDECTQFAANSEEGYYNILNI